MLTMDDVARRAGVARSTVSHVLNGRHNANVRIPESTRRRVLDAAQELGYHPNALARSVRSGKTRMIGYLVEDQIYEPYWKTIVGALNEAEQADFSLKLLSATPETFAQRIQQCMELRLSGMIVRYCFDKSFLFEEAQRAGIPVVTVDEDVPQPYGARVAADDAVGCREAVSHLVQLGHRRIAFITAGFYRKPPELVPVRESHFLAELASHGLPVPEGYIVAEEMVVYGSGTELEIDTSTVLAATNRLLTHPEGRPTAIVCWRDEAAIVAMQACRRAGLRVPEDMSVVGFSDIHAARTSDPSLSTCQSPWDQMGRTAVRQLVRALDLEDPCRETILIPSRFIARHSSGPVPPVVQEGCVVAL